MAAPARVALELGSGNLQPMGRWRDWTSDGDGGEIERGGVAAVMRSAKARGAMVATGAGAGHVRAIRQSSD